MRITIAVVAGSLLVACGGGSSSDAQAAGGLYGPRAMGPRTAATCPLPLEGAHVAVEDTDDGVAMTFTTERPADVDELRQRVEAMPTTLDRPTAEAPASTVAVVRAVPEGARIEISAIEKADIEPLRERALVLAEDVRGARGCPRLPDEPPV